MRHRVHTFKIGRTSAHRKAMLANMVSSLIESGTIKTTVVKAKEARRLADRMVTLGKKGTLHHRRLAVSYLRDKTAVKKLFDEIAPSFEGRPGGYTRIIRLGFRQGDSAEMCMLQLTNNDVAAEPKKAKKAEKAEPAAAEPKAKKAPAKKAAKEEGEEKKTKKAPAKKSAAKADEPKEEAKAVAAETEEVKAVDAQAAEEAKAE